MEALIACLAVFGSVGGFFLAGAWFIEDWRPHWMRVRNGSAIAVLTNGRRDCADRWCRDHAQTPCGKCWEHCPRCARREADKPERQVAAMERDLGMDRFGGSR